MKKQKWLSLLLTPVLVMSMYPVNAFAANTATERSVTSSTTAASSYEEPMLVENEYDLDGDETKDSVYEIATASELLWFAEHVNNGNGKTNAVLVEDIDLSGKSFTPIGVNYSDFSGIFDGQGHVIKNMKFSTVQNGYDNHLTYDYQGLFGVIREGAIVRNFTVTGEIILTTGDMSNIGGAVGLAYEGSTISNVVSRVNINDGSNIYSNISYIGGVVGQIGNNYLTNTSATVENCKYYGTIDVDTASAVGGIVGQSIQSSTISNCLNYGVVGSNYIGHAGGVVGSAQSGTTVTECVNYGSISVIHHDCIGGIAGYANKNVSITGCVNIGTVTAKKSSISNTDVYLGGILGYVNNESFGGITDCFNYGKVTASDGGTTYCGALVGWIRNSKSAPAIKNNYWYTGSSSKAYGSGGGSTGTTKTALQVTSSSTTWSTGWYIVTENVTVSSRIKVDGDVKLLLTNGKTLTAEKGIDVREYYDEELRQGFLYKLAIYACTEGSNMGKLIADARKTENAGIGGSFESPNGYGYGVITIHGGEITATGGSGGAGIGGSRSGSASYYESYVIVNGGIVNATGGTSAAGIGGGSYADKAGNVVINGGTVNANGGSGGAGIGGGTGDVADSIWSQVTVVINGGTVNATGGSGGAGIGGGTEAKHGTITINGGIIDAVGGHNASGIGREYDGSGFTVTITGGTVSAFASGVNDFMNAYHKSSPSITKYRYCRVFLGDTEDNAKEADRVTTGIEYNVKYVRIEPCTGKLHEAAHGTAQDIEFHKARCKWCRRYYRQEHKYDESGVCICKMEKVEANAQGVYEIRTAGELLGFAAMVNQDTSKRYTAKLMNDISPVGKSHLPIDLYRGSFDGQGYTIKTYYSNDANGTYGFFRETQDADIRNFTVTNFGIHIRYNGMEGIGGIVGKARNTTISNVRVEGRYYRCSGFESVSGIGGVVGVAAEGTCVENCSANMELFNTTYGSGEGSCSKAGGIIGTTVGGTVSNPVKVIGCTFEGKFLFDNTRTQTSYIGGIIGYAEDVTIVERCTHNGTLKGYSYIGKGTGGIVGYGEQLTIKNCRSLGTVTDSIRTLNCIGGILGTVNDKNFGGVSNCYSRSSISGSDWTQKGAIVGYIGNDTPTDGIVNNYYSYGGVEDSEKAFGTQGKRGEATFASSTMFSSGEITYRLNSGVTDGTQIWYQTKGTDNQPQYVGKTIYYNEEANPAYFNAELGDINCDSYMDARDIVRMKKNLETEKHSETSDLNKDGSINIDDLAMLKKYLVGSITAF